MTQPLIAPKALAFKCGTTIDKLLARLNEIGPWQWRLGDSDTYGLSVWSMPIPARMMLRIFEDPRWTLEITAGSDVTETEGQAIMRVLTERIFPAIKARDIRPTEPVT